MQMERDVHCVRVPERDVHCVRVPDRDVHCARVPERDVHCVRVPERDVHCVRVPVSGERHLLIAVIVTCLKGLSCSFVATTSFPITCT